MFMDADGNSDFTLHLNFPNKNAFLIQSIIGMSLLSFLFGSIILFVFISAVYQWIKQKKISEIKSDFINNMTHEFKTPIATINLAVEAIKNPKINSDQEKVLRYANMIRDENNRMHAQVENVLQISKLDKNELDIKMQEVDIHEIIEDAIAHVDLIVSDRKGVINTHFEMQNTDLVASEMHLTNVIVNILENASKYSPEVPVIDIYTREKNNQIEIAIQDQGAGMSKQVLKHVFDKFYREPTGNIHNIKGHGLGLAYVKKIVELHHGTVYAESEVGKGSTFYIQLPFKK
jgi:two-component system phosphate regulon sensor histidine kinase PhoR